MTDFKVGDRVRATLGENVVVGVVTAVGSAPSTIQVEPDGAGHCLWLTVPAGWHIEEVPPPLPTKVCAIVRRADGELFVRRGGRKVLHWCPAYGILDELRDSEVSNGGFKVIFEGVESDD